MTMLLKLPRFVIYLLLAAALLALGGCAKEYNPKPKGWNRIDLPQPKYQPLQEKHPYWFEYSAYARILPDSSLFNEKHWMDLYYPRFKANVQITYKALQNDPRQVRKLMEDSRKLAAKHQVKAYSIQEAQLRTPSGLTATVFELEGEVPSQFQFFVTDSSKHFLRGALYFRTATSNDSLAPVIEYIKRDCVHLLNTLKF